MNNENNENWNNYFEEDDTEFNDDFVNSNGKIVTTDILLVE